MKPASTPDASACQSWDLVSAALSSGKQAALAAKLGWTESKVSELKPRLRDGCILLESLGLRVVPGDLEVFDARQIDALLSTLKISIQAMSVEKLRVEP